MTDGSKRQIKKSDLAQFQTVDMDATFGNDTASVRGADNDPSEPIAEVRNTE